MIDRKIPRSSGYTKEAEFFGRLMQIRDLAHLTHLRQFHKSGWEHKALNILYDEVLDIVDTIIESWQGIYGLVDVTVPESKPQQDSIQMTREIYNYIMTSRSIFQESWLQNEIDNVCTLLAQTLYRLQYLK
jgi:hypothetical protein